MRPQTLLHISNNIYGCPLIHDIYSVIYFPYPVICFQVENVGSLTMSRVSAAASVKLTAKHLDSVVIEDSTFQVVRKNAQKILREDFDLIVDLPFAQVLPWPGIFFYNTTSVLLTRYSSYSIYYYCVVPTRIAG